MPVYLLARRYVRTRSALGIAGLVAIFPSTTYTSLVMTESLAFLTMAWLLVAMVRALERPSLLRQLVALALLVVLFELRTQYIVLFAAWPLAIGSNALLRRRGTTTSLLAALRSWWPTAAVCLVGLVAVLGMTFSSGSDADGIGAYDALVKSYSVADVALAVIRQIGDLAIFLAVVPLVVAPTVIASLARRRSTEGDAFVSLFVPLNVVLILTVGMFASSEWAVGSLHDRNLFVLFPLWLIVLFCWLDGPPSPRSDRLLAAGVVLAIGAVISLPFSEIAAEGWLEQHEAPSTEIWGLVGRVIHPLWLPLIAAAVVVALGTVLVGHRWRSFVVAGIALVLFANLASAWRSALIDPTTNGAAERGQRNWVDRAIGTDTRATLLLVDDSCNQTGVGPSGLMTMFFNRSVVNSVVIGSQGIAKPIPAKVSPAGAVILERDGRPLTTRYVITAPTLRLRGRELARGAPAGLVLWETTSPVTVVGAAPRPCPPPG